MQLGKYKVGKIQFVFVDGEVDCLITFEGEESFSALLSELVRRYDYEVLYPEECRDIPYTNIIFNIASKGFNLIEVFDFEEEEYYRWNYL